MGTILNIFDHTPVTYTPDSDADGVNDQDDDCPNTESGIFVDEQGCDLDSDADGLRDSDDQCPQTDPGVIVDNTGCDLDSDNDGVRDR